MDVSAQSTHSVHNAKPVHRVPSYVSIADLVGTRSRSNSTVSIASVETNSAQVSPEPKPPLVSSDVMAKNLSVEHGLLAFERGWQEARSSDAAVEHGLLAFERGWQEARSSDAAVEHGLMAFERGWQEARSSDATVEHGLMAFERGWEGARVGVYCGDV